MVKPIPVYSIRYYKLVWGWFRYPDQYYDISRICEMVGNHYPFPLKYEGRAYTARQAEGGPKGLKACITLETLRDRTGGYAIDDKCEIMTRVSKYDWISTEGVAQLLAHEVAHLLTMEHCGSAGCLFSRMPGWTWDLCERHQRWVRLIATLLYRYGWGRVSTM